MTEYALHRAHSCLEFRFEAEVKNVEPRPHPYGRGSFLPDTLYFTLVSSRDDGLMPLAEDMEAANVTISGLRLRSNGQPGTFRLEDRLYGFRDRPDWAQEIITEAKRQVRLLGWDE